MIFKRISLCSTLQMQVQTALITQYFRCFQTVFPYKSFKLFIIIRVIFRLEAIKEQVKAKSMEEQVIP